MITDKQHDTDTEHSDTDVVEEEPLLEGTGPSPTFCEGIVRHLSRVRKTRLLSTPS